jgi:uncharacterized membrane protein YphA (DoxX/SURF4 family)
MLKYKTSKTTKTITLMAQGLAILIMGQTLFFKFSGAEESKYIFTTLGMEPEGRILIGVFELIACVLLFIPAYVWAGALLGTGLMIGALFFHITKLGFEIMNDGGELVYFAIAALVSCLLILFMRRDQIPIIKNIILFN